MTVHKPAPTNHAGVLEEIASALDISEAQYKEAESRYQSVGDWLNRDGSTLKHFDPEISPQGSFVLGTVIRPLGDRDEFDVDLVCLLSASKTTLTQKGLKHAVGREVKDYVLARRMASMPAEGRRCWTLHYAGDTRFHLDVVPAVPDSIRYRDLLLESRHLSLARDEGLTGEAIAITDNKSPTYDQITDDWPQSNPKGYAAWFRRKMADQILAGKRILTEGTILASVEDIPDYRVKTPLQRGVQLLKRHRDFAFVQDHTYKPKSILITTLAALSYQQEESVAEALRRMLDRMATHIEERDGAIWIPNPVDPSENFARDWNEDRKHAREFHRWLNQARADFAGYLDGNYQLMSESLKTALGKRPTDGVFGRFPSSAPIVAAPAILTGPMGQDPMARANTAIEDVRRRGTSSRPWAE